MFGQMAGKISTLVERLVEATCSCLPGVGLMQVSLTPQGDRARQSDVEHPPAAAGDGQSRPRYKPESRLRSILGSFAEREDLRCM